MILINSKKNKEIMVVLAHHPLNKNMSQGTTTRIKRQGIIAKIVF
jgi:hypothetical protein